MLVGNEDSYLELLLTLFFLNFMLPELNNKENWFLGISPEGIGSVGMVLNLTITLLVSRFTKEYATFQGS